MQLRRAGPFSFVASVVLGSVLLASGGGAAGAMQPVRDWSGPYVGLFAGYGWGRGAATAPYDSNTGFFYNWTGSPYSSDLDGAIVGGTFGINLQSHSIVYGLEGEIGYFGLRGSAVDPNNAPGVAPWLDTETSVRSDFFGALSGRAGIVAGDALFYVKGGLAMLNARASTVDPIVSPPTNTTLLTMDGRRFMVGWSLGGGVEWALNPAWSVKAEYAYFDFGHLRTSGPSSVPGELYRQTIDVTAHTVRIGVNHRFGAQPAAVRAMY